MRSKSAISSVKPRVPRVRGRVTLYLTLSNYASLRDYCASRRLSTSAVIDALVADYLAGGE